MVDRCPAARTSFAVFPDRALAVVAVRSILGSPGIVSTSDLGFGDSSAVHRRSGVPVHWVFGGRRVPEAALDSSRHASPRRVEIFFALHPPTASLFWSGGHPKSAGGDCVDADRWAHRLCWIFASALRRGAETSSREIRGALQTCVDSIEEGRGPLEARLRRSARQRPIDERIWGRAAHR